MAASDTAKLIAALTLKDGFTGPLKNANLALNSFDAKLSNTQGRAFKAGQQIGTGIRNGVRIAVAAVGTLTGLLLLSAKEGQEAANVQKVYATAIANSGKVTAANVAALNAQQEALLDLAGVDDELIKTEQTRLIQMDLTGAQVAKLTPLILDLSKATGKDLLTVTVAVGKAALGNATALQRLGIVLPKVEKATKSQALATLELQKKQLAANLATAKAKGPMSDAQKATFAQKKLDLEAAIAQQKLTDAKTKGSAATSTYADTVKVLNDRFGGTAAALSGSLDTRLAVLRERLANVREEAGIKLLPALTRIVDVVGSRLVPAFGEFIDAVLPSVISGLDKLAAALEGGAASQGVQTILRTVKSVLPAIEASAKLTGQVISTAVNLFRSLPPELQALAVTGLAINKLTGGLVTNIAGGLISAVISSFRGMMNVNAAVVNVNGAVAGGGVAGATGAGGFPKSLLTGLLRLASIGIGTGAVVAGQQSQDPTQRVAGNIGGGALIGLGVAGPIGALTGALIGLTETVREGQVEGVNKLANANATALQKMIAENPNDIGGLQNALDAIDRGIADINSNPLNVLVQGDALATLTAMRQQADVALLTAKSMAAGEDRSYDAIEKLRATTVTGLSSVTAAVMRAGFDAKATLKSVIEGIQKRSAEKFGGKGLGGGAVAATFQRLQLRNADRVLKANQSVDRKIARLTNIQKLLVTHGDTRTAAKVTAQIKRLQTELRRKDLTAEVNVTIPIRNYFNGRLVAANLDRYSSKAGILTSG